MNTNSKTKKKSVLSKKTIIKSNQYQTIATQNQIDIDYYQKKKLLNEHLFDTLKPNIYTVCHYLEISKFNYYNS